ncbi:hypothetical protein [Methylobacterium soli]|uniref:RNA polymerase sigma factor 70 region 1.1 domain-containing protein n=2 Tax=Methylobacterium soli TaxID=553447 RepID=A0A6L3SUQ7_9HYPH|nr:hypothetical protein [Methylobacterium soli]KAB1077393.1 hypothetical protein F6X53_18910 [Methylobacterium soli]
MAAGIDKDTLERLIALGQRKGRLSPEDLLTGLPVDRMSAEDIALVVLEIEEAGVPVEVEETLAMLARPGERPSMPVPVAPLPPLPPPPGGEARLAPQPIAAQAPAAAEAPARVSTDAAAERAEVNRIVALAGLATLLILGLGVLVLGR